jgi:hypothetical protein
MNMNRNEIAQGVADRLFATEEAVDTAMVRAAGLIQGMVEARRELNVSATTGEVALARAAEAVAALSEARRAVMAAHAALSSLSTKMDVEIFTPEKKDGERQAAAAPIRLASA